MRALRDGHSTSGFDNAPTCTGDDQGDVEEAQPEAPSTAQPAINGASQRVVSTPEPTLQAEPDTEPVLRSTLDTQVIPELLSSYRDGIGTDATQVAQPPSLIMRCGTSVEPLAEALLANDLAAAQAMLDALLAAGVPAERVCLDVLAPAADNLGERWTEDLCHFVDVTLALGRLQRLLNELCDQAQVLCLRDRSVLLLSLPGEQHTFGLRMVAAIFRLHGWTAEVGVAGPHALDRLRNEAVDTIGIALAGDRRLDELRDAIRNMRAAADPRSPAVLVGGPILRQRPDLVEQLGADCAALDAAHAVAQAERLLGKSG